MAKGARGTTSESNNRHGVAVRWGIHFIAAYVGGLLIGAPIGLVLYGMTQVDTLLTAAILISMTGGFMWRLTHTGRPRDRQFTKR